MKLVYAPSAKRMIPYPPVGVAVLAASLAQCTEQHTEVIDLEAILNERHHAGNSCLLYTDGLLPQDVICEQWSPKIIQYGHLLMDLAGIKEGDNLGISVMGFAQVASALLLARLALEAGCRVILGGQFWTPQSAREVLHALAAYGDAVVTVGDGWEAVQAFVTNQLDTPPNSVATRNGQLTQGERTTSTVPPTPDFSSVQWQYYEAQGCRTYKRDEAIRRAHLYLWDKRCNFRCAFCRVSSGSTAKLTPPEQAVASLTDLMNSGVRQLNIMTNELNPSRAYLLRFLSELERRIDNPPVWFTYLRADRLEQNDLDRVGQAGGRLIRYGIESGSQRLLNLMRKDYQVAIMADTLRFAERAGIWNHVNLLVGFPGETEEDVSLTCQFLHANAPSIHSVRINPFYLPPETPIARAPEQFGIQLGRFNKGWWEYQYVDGTDPDITVVTKRIDRIAAACVKLGIGFAGTDPFFLLDMVARYPRRDDALTQLKRDYPFFWEPAPTDVYKAKLGGYTISTDWKDTTLKRGSNYSLTLCTD